MDAVQDNTGLKRFELTQDGITAWSSYARDGNVVDIQHTLVPEEARGKGMASVLIKGSLDLLRSRGEKLIPTCPFVATYLRRHPGYQTLLADMAYLDKHPAK
jgi:predicted GNAT family acetyltransferase